MANSRKFWLSEEELRKLYIDGGLWTREIATMYGVSSATVLNWLHAYKIPRKRNRNWVSGVDEEELRRLYIDEKLTIKQICQLLKKPKTIIQARVRDFGLRISREEQETRRRERNTERCAHRTKTSGYWRVMRRDHPGASQDGYVAEHRLVVETAIGRYLNEHEQVHHLDFDKGNNSLLNLVLVPDVRNHARLHKYTERVGAYMVGRLKVRPDALHFENPVFFEGRWTHEIDLIGNRKPADDLERVFNSTGTVSEGSVLVQ